MKDIPIIALDFATVEEVEEFLNLFDEPLFVKIGMELYLQNGIDIIKKIKSRGHDIFLDLKLHDIPNTVYGALNGLGKFDIDLINVHAAGGVQMMEAGLAGLRSTNPDAKLIAVTQLTSTSTEQMNDDQNIQTSVEDSVLHYARKAKVAKLDGVVCSPLESKLIKDELGETFLKVTPGIRLESDKTHDQQRVTTPEDAKKLGSTHIVVGRSITEHEDPVSRYHDILQRWKG
ncbi:orotidine-5'-phosphate decarboxylase [Mammaliicoccus stepanovicii]|uniref:Orotidine 5'-phosphate decarboxylase n=1 Tax=Mammaliicoccus stepanovicii TaxID=643214 RepID=A0A239ZJC3_9STAP|nr:orotidine-5'-phosphate decarboxylase [Mammaliicoccus stepanovicii]PNZ77935.1 orotidine-5'-phosphate decarboxylase [Mammaliicoccus stepanovicii]GGI41649.1 orotidine 5'-phosphate decarboxylase [Mammaliicoccus stepanovicii]SNV71382.1 orotidine 5'-phosphate decarboxylase [Mammaliicoccus stepanovicii]